MKRGFSSSSEEDVYGRRRSACAACLRSTPWWAFIAAALFGAGLAAWIAGAAKIQDSTIQVARAIEVVPSVTDALRTAVITSILAIGVSGLIVCVLVVLLALFRTGLSTALFSTTSCCSGGGSNGKGPEPWTFTTFRLLVGMLNVVVWLLLVAVVAVLMTMLAWFGLSVAINSAIASSRSASGAFSDAVNLASDSAAAAQAYITPLVSSQAAAAELLGASNGLTLPFQPLCAPVCLNLGSFAQLLQSASCVCGAAKLAAIAGAASEGVRVGAVALAGAAAMYAGATLLLMILTAQYVTAKYDRSAARLRQRRAARDYENGFVADPADCLQGGADDDSDQQQQQQHYHQQPARPLATAAPGAAAMMMMHADDVRGQRDVLGNPVVAPSAPPAALAGMFGATAHHQHQQQYGPQAAGGAYPSVSHAREGRLVNPFAKQQQHNAGL